MLTTLRFPVEGPPVAGSTLAEAEWSPGAEGTTWIDLETPDADELRVLKDPFRFHPLAIEDCLTPEHQPKVEDFDSYVFLIFRGIDFTPPVSDFQTLKLAAFLGPNYLVTYHRSPMRSVAAVREKYIADPATVRTRRPDALLYEILGHMIEFYFPVLDSVEAELDELEEAVFEQSGPETLDRILAAKRKVVEVRRTVAPHREVFARVSRGEFGMIADSSVAFYRDLYDSTYRLTEEADSYRDLLSSTLDAYLSMASHRLNEVMKVLTIFATIMLPLTFIVGVYGMNFDYIPELQYRYGYFVVWGVMLVITGGMLWSFRRRGWL